MHGQRSLPSKKYRRGGYNFEDKVVAYFFACLLTDQPLLDVRYGTIERLDFQVHVDGWHLDDVLVTLRSPRGRHRMPMSLKSNQQFSKDAVPADFVESAWETFLDRAKTKFDPALDLLGFVTLPPDAKLLHQFHELMTWARAQDTADLARRVEEAGYGKDLKRSLLKSFTCPASVATQFAQGSHLTADILQCTHHFAYDFEQEPSNDLRRALDLCRSAVTSGELADARQLWDVLCGQARDLRPLSGFINLTRLLDRLRGRFVLKFYPQYEPDWNRLRQMYQDSVARVPDLIGGRVRLPRTQEMEKLRSMPASLVALIGKSGCGKSALSKQFVEATSADATILWFDARAFDVPNFAAFEHQLQLLHPLTDLLAAFPGSSGYVVVDGLDRLFDPHAFANVATLLAKLRADKDSPWRVLLTSQPEEWGRLQLEFLKANFRQEWSIFDVEAPMDFSPLWEVFPDLEDLSRRNELRSLLLNPGILDLLALRIDSADPNKWAGESDLIEWLWHSVIAKQPRAAVRAGFVGTLGEKQGDSMRIETPLTDFPPADLPPFDELVQDRICVSREGRAAFHHERYGDWARQRVLLSRIQDLNTYLADRISTPTWHTAIRLLGLHLLEQNGTIDRWKSVFTAAAIRGDDEPSLLQDLLLEAVIFASDPKPLLQRLWPELTANEGFWLKRLLTRFLHVATLPHPMMAVAIPEAAIEASAALRVPYWPYWLPILGFLCNHRDDLLAFAPRQAAELVSCWLRQGGKTWPLRREVAEIGLGLGRQMLRTLRDKSAGYSREKLPKLCFRAALVAASELPDEVGQFALDAAERIDTDRVRPTRTERHSGLHGAFTLEYPSPWPDGPRESVAKAFADEVSEIGGLVPLITTRPAIAREVLLAVLIDEPKPRSPWEDRSMHRRHLDVHQVRRWHPPFYLRGPFLIFLKLSPVEGLEVILRLVNFAFERWSQILQEHNEVAPTVKMLLPNGEKTLLGDYQVYMAYSDNAAWPHSVISALMALEKWLYEELEEGKPIDGHIETILRRGNSVAFVGILNAVACKESSLWLGPLRSLLAVPEFHNWELQRSILGRNRVAMMGWGREPGMARLAQEWQSLPHRQKFMDKEAVRMFVTDEDIQAFTTEQSRKWDEQRALETNPGHAHWLKQLAPRFRIENYVAYQHPNGKQIQYVPPEELRAENETQLSEINERQGLMAFPLYCCQLLEKGAALTDEEAAGIWQRVERFSQMPQDPEEDDDGIMRTKNCVCGGIAVLMTLNSKWLNADPVKKEWCVERIYEITTNPPPAPQFDWEGDSSDWDWRTFCARIACLLWAEAPADPNMRQLVASLVATRKYKTVEILFRAAASVRTKLGDSFQELQDFVFDWAGVRWRHEQSQEQQNAGEWLQREIDAFAQGRRPLRSAPWAVANESSSPSAQTPPARGRWAKYPRLDLELIKAAYAWMPKLSKAENPRERSAWIGFWSYAQGLSLQVVKAPLDENDEDGEQEPTPYDFDEWVIGNIAHFILQLEPGEREAFWKPFMELGSKAHYWVERFLYHWLTVGLGGDKIPAEFAAEWRKMIEFARSSPLWTTDSDWRRHREELWIELMGLDVLVLWIADHQDLVAGIRDLFADWADQHLKGSDSAGAFAYFLQNPAAEKILCDGIKWLEKANPNLKSFGRTGELVGIIAPLLAKTWQHHSTQILGDADALAAFKRLLQRLCELQNPIALELADRMRGA